MFERAVTIIQNADAIPKFWFLTKRLVKYPTLLLEEIKLLDQEDGIELVGMKNKLVEGRPS